MLDFVYEVLREDGTKVFETLAVENVGIVIVVHSESFAVQFRISSQRDQEWRSDADELVFRTPFYAHAELENLLLPSLAL
jgi:hypothetical protein